MMFGWGNGIDDDLQDRNKMQGFGKVDEERCRGINDGLKKGGHDLGVLEKIREKLRQK